MFNTIFNLLWQLFNITVKVTWPLKTNKRKERRQKRRERREKREAERKAKEGKEAKEAQAQPDGKRDGKGDGKGDDKGHATEADANEGNANGVKDGKDANVNVNEKDDDIIKIWTTYRVYCEN